LATNTLTVIDGHELHHHRHHLIIIVIIIV